MRCSAAGGPPRRKHPRDESRPRTCARLPQTHDPHPCAVSYPAGTSAAAGPRSEVASQGLIMARRAIRAAAKAERCCSSWRATQHAPTNFD